MEAAATRAALLDAAERVFRERGVAHTSLAEIAAAAGVTRGAVYWHFRDKTALFEALCERVQLPMEAMLASAGEIRQKDPLGALRALAVNGLVRLATDARTQAVFDVIFHKCEFTAEFAVVSGRRHATDSGCLANVERLLTQAVSGRATASRYRHPARGAVPQCLHGRRDARVGAGAEVVRSRASGAGNDRFAARRDLPPGRRGASAGSRTPPARGQARDTATPGSALTATADARAQRRA